MQIMVFGERKDPGQGSQRYSEIDFVRHLELGPSQNRSLGLKIVGLRCWAFCIALLGYQERAFSSGKQRVGQILVLAGLRA